jgi:hypothetical protein
LGKEFSLLAHGTLQFKPNKFIKFKWMWAREREISKLLGTSFGLHLGVQDVDSLWTKSKGNSSFGALPICKL